MNHSVKDTIRRRKSVRTFNGAALRKEDRQKLEQYLETLDNPFDVPVEFRFLDAKKSEAIGIGTVMLAATISRKAFEKAMAVRDTEVMPAVSPVGYPAEKRSVREALMRKGLKADENKQPWRVVVCGDKVHFYEKKTKSMSENPGFETDDLMEYIMTYEVTN